jgi:hypothetical protein
VDAKAEVTCGAAGGCVTTDPLFANASAGDYGLTVAVERFSCAKSLEKVLFSRH